MWVEFNDLMEWVESVCDGIVCGCLEWFLSILCDNHTHRNDEDDDDDNDDGDIEVLYVYGVFNC